MPQASLLGWMKAKPAKVKKVKRSNLTKRPAPERAYRFLLDFPEGIMTPDGPAGPFRKGDLVSADVMPSGIWGVLLKKGAVEPAKLRPEWPGQNGQSWR